MKRLTPLTMRQPFIYGKSKHRRGKIITNAEFDTFNSRKMTVSLDKDGVSNPQQLMAYGLGFDAWYLAEDVGNE